MGEVVQLRDYQRKDEAKPDEGNGGSKDKQNRAFWIGQPDTSPCEFTAPLDDPA